MVPVNSICPLQTSPASVGWMDCTVLGRNCINRHHLVSSANLVSFFLNNFLVFNSDIISHLCILYFDYLCKSHYQGQIRNQMLQLCKKYSSKLAQSVRIAAVIWFGQADWWKIASHKGKNHWIYRLCMCVCVRAHWYAHLMADKVNHTPYPQHYYS